MPSIESYELLLAAAAACDEKKAEDVRILALDPAESGLADYFLICNGTNDRQNVAITDEIEIRLKRDFSTYPNSVEGRRQGEWILMDYVDFIVHVFSPEKRAYYGLERLRKSATSVSIDDLSTELKAAIAATRKKRSAAPSGEAAIPSGRTARPAKVLANRKASSDLKKPPTRATAAKTRTKAAGDEGKTIKRPVKSKSPTVGKVSAKRPRKSEG